MLKVINFLVLISFGLFAHAGDLWEQNKSVKDISFILKNDEIINLLGNNTITKIVSLGNRKYELSFEGCNLDIQIHVKCSDSLVPGLGEDGNCQIFINESEILCAK